MLLLRTRPVLQLPQLSHHGIASRVGKKRADLAHQPLDPVIVTAPWVAAGGLAYLGIRGLLKTVANRP